MNTNLIMEQLSTAAEIVRGNGKQAPYKQETRELACLAIDQGVSARRIAETLKVSPQTIQIWLKKSQPSVTELHLVEDGEEVVFTSVYLGESIRIDIPSSTLDNQFLQALWSLN